MQRRKDPCFIGLWIPEQRVCLRNSKIHIRTIAPCGLFVYLAQTRMRLFCDAFVDARKGTDRLDTLFGFERALEVYLKPEQRKYGYFTTPILYGDRLVGRLDPKLDRKEKKLIVRGLWYEDGFKPDEVYENEFQKTLDDFARFNGAEKIEWRLEKSPTSV